MTSRISQAGVARRGFTLEETMVVVVIIGLLAALVLLAFQRAKRNAVSKAVTIIQP